MKSLCRNRKALANKKDYVDWVSEAKLDETRRRRLETAVEWMAEGKIRNWKYVRNAGR